MASTFPAASNGSAMKSGCRAILAPEAAASDQRPPLLALMRLAPGISFQAALHLEQSGRVAGVAGVGQAFVMFQLGGMGGAAMPCEIIRGSDGK